VQTCTIIGNPAISASGLFGSRVEPSRAGIITIGLDGLGTDRLYKKLRRIAASLP
jgi:hypothetical protein